MAEHTSDLKVQIGLPTHRETPVPRLPTISPPPWIWREWIGYSINPSQLLYLHSAHKPCPRSERLLGCFWSKNL